MTRHAGLIVGMLLLANAAAGQFAQQGSKLVGTGTVGAAGQGYSVAISADGNTVIVGGYADNYGIGASWVFTRTGGVWSQQGNKLVGAGAAGSGFSQGANQGLSVAISADGNTAIVGGAADSPYGAAWVFTRSDGAWSQQGGKLVGAGAVGGAKQGWSVAISGDGNTAIVGGLGDNWGVGAAWVFTRSDGAWSQQGGKLIGTGAVGGAQQGGSVAISADGNSVIVGGNVDNGLRGAAWVFTRNGGVWSQQGSKLFGTGSIGPAEQGRSVAVSADGNIAIVGGPSDNSNVGAVWVFSRSDGVWSEQGSKLVGTGAVGGAEQGTSVAISADGNSVIVGGPNDEGDTGGAAWVYMRSGGVWAQQGNKLAGTGGTAGFAASQGQSVALSADGTTAIVGGPADNSYLGAAWVFVSNGIIICVPPSIVLQPPENLGVEEGTSATLSVTVTGTAPLSYQWYQGAAGDTSRPLRGDASTFVTPPLGSRASFWVRITNACGSIDSATATVGVWRRVRRHLRRAM
jgi:hypothetical protein